MCQINVRNGLLILRPQARPKSNDNARESENKMAQTTRGTAYKKGHHSFIDEEAISLLD
jgi:hypothetical protein